MLWHASSTPQRPAPLGEAVMTCAGHPGFHEHQRWRS
jgi:hypothetical protein